MQRKLRAAFMRGGTSKALVFLLQDLPADRADWDHIFLAAMGSPDPYGRQLDGMGGGSSSLSKVCVVGPSARDDADVDYTFAQVAVDQALVDYAGNCGNMSAAVGPFALDEGLVDPPEGDSATVAIYNTNTNTIIHASFPTRDGVALVEGETMIDGVAGPGAPVKLTFVNPGGRKTGRLLPTGNIVDTLTVAGRGVRATLIDAGNPCVFVSAEDLGLSGTETPDQIAQLTGVLEELEQLRRQASVLMGLSTTSTTAGDMASIPKIAMVAKPTDSVTLSGRKLAGAEADLLIRMLSMGQPHRAVPATGALCVAVAARIKGSVAQEQIEGDIDPSSELRVAHPSGVLRVDADVVSTGDVTVRSASVIRTARRLFEGSVFYR